MSSPPPDSSVEVRATSTTATTAGNLSFVIETPPLQSHVNLYEESLLTEDLKQQLVDFTKNSKEKKTNDDNSSISLGEALRDVLPVSFKFTSLYQLAQYLQSALVRSYGESITVHFLPVATKNGDGTKTSDTNGTGTTSDTASSTNKTKTIIMIRQEGSNNNKVQLKLQLDTSDGDTVEPTVETNKEGKDPAESPLTILEFNSDEAMDIDIDLTQKNTEKAITSNKAEHEATQPAASDSAKATKPGTATMETPQVVDGSNSVSTDPPADNPTKKEDDPPMPPLGEKNNKDANNKRSPRKAAMVNYKEEDEESEQEQDDDDDTSSEDEVIAVMTRRSKRNRARSLTLSRRTLAGKVATRSNSTRGSNTNKKSNNEDHEDDDEDEEDDDDTDDKDKEPQETAGEAQKKRFAEQWQTMFGKLKTYKAEHGDCLVPKDYPLDQSLGSWVHAQRSNYRLKTMPQTRIEALEAIDFPWKVRDIQSWETMYERLQIYHSQFGNSDVPRKCPSDPRLGRWVQQQRRDYREGKLPQDKVALLENVAFVWRVAATAKGGVRRENYDEWNRMYAKLQQYQLEHGDCLVPREYEKDLELGRWVRQQRTRKSLSDQQKASLNALGFMWKVPHKKKAQVSFEEMLERLKGFKEKYGDCMVPAIYPDDLPLGRWVQRMRQDYKKNILTDQQIFQMDSLGFTWKCARGRQKINYASDIPNYFQSQEYLQKFNNSNSLDPNNPHQLQQPQQEGAIWSPKAAPEFWEAQFQKLKQYQAQHGHCNVPRNHFEDQSLAKFVVAQRSFYHKQQLSEENIQKLESIGFVWRVQRHWEENMQLLEAYYQKHGNTDVPVDYAEDPKLGRWVREQRLFSKRKELTQERIDRMKAIGFVWNAPGATSALTKRPKSMTCPKDAPTVVAGLGAVVVAPDTAITATAVKDDPNNGGSSNSNEVGVPVASAALKEKTAKLQQANAKLGEDRKNLKIENQELRRKLREAEEKNFWESRFEQLQIYKDMNGNCLVPTGHSKLGAWVGTQRELYRKGELSQERIDKLESLQFAWSRPKGRPKKEENAQRSESEKLMEEEIALQEEKVKLLEARVKLKQEKLKLRLIKDSTTKRKSTSTATGTGGASATDEPAAKKPRASI